MEFNQTNNNTGSVINAVGDARKRVIPSVGDVCRLATGGPDMVVHAIGVADSQVLSNEVVCRWFVGTELKEASFAISSLVFDVNFGIRSRKKKGWQTLGTIEGPVTVTFGDGRKRKL